MRYKLNQRGKSKMVKKKPKRRWKRFNRVKYLNPILPCEWYYSHNPNFKALVKVLRRDLMFAPASIWQKKVMGLSIGSTYRYLKMLEEANMLDIMFDGRKLLFKWKTDQDNNPIPASFIIDEEYEFKKTLKDFSDTARERLAELKKTLTTKEDDDFWRKIKEIEDRIEKLRRSSNE